MQIRLHIHGSVYVQLKDAIDSAPFVCMGKQQMSEECFYLVFFPSLNVKGIQAKRASLYTCVLTQISQILNKFVALGVGILDKGRLRVAMR